MGNEYFAKYGNRLKHLVIGLGSIGKRHKRLLEEAGETVVGIDKGDTLKLKNIDMVWICTPIDTHKKFIQEAMFRGVPRIFVEKPIVSNVASAVSINKEKGNSRIWVAQNMRFHPGAIAIKENLNKVGKIHYARLWFQHSIKNQRENWEEYMKQTDIEMDCIQWIDLALWLFGSLQDKFPRRIIRFIEKINEDFIDYTRFTMEHKSEIISFIDLDFLRQDKSCGIEVIGEKGTLVWNLRGKKPSRSITSFIEPKDIPLGIDEHILYWSDIDQDKIYRDQLDYLLKDQWQSNIDDAIASLEVALG